MKKLSMNEYKKAKEEKEEVACYWDYDKEESLNTPVMCKVNKYTEEKRKINDVDCIVLVHENGFYNGMDGSWYAESKEDCGYIKLRDEDYNFWVMCTSENGNDRFYVTDRFPGYSCFNMDICADIYTGACFDTEDEAEAYTQKRNEKEKMHEMMERF